MPENSNLESRRPASGAANSGLRAAASSCSKRGCVLLKRLQASRRRLVRFALFVAASSFAHADLVIVQRVEGSGQKGTMTMKIKGDKVRTDLSPEVSTITDGSTGDVVTLMHQQQSFMRIPAASANDLRERLKEAGVPGGTTPTAPPKLQALGKKEKISGYETEQYGFELGTMKVKYWIAKTFPNHTVILEQMGKAQGNGIGSMLKDLTPGPGDFPGLPLKTEVEMKNNSTPKPQKVTTTIVSVTEQAVSDSEVSVPAGYKEAPVPSLELAPQ